MITAIVFSIVGAWLALFAFGFVISIIFGRKWSLERTLDLRRDQLAIVQKGRYHKRRLLNGEEYQLFRMLENWIADRSSNHRLFAQVSMGEILGSDDRLAYACVNSKRCDFVIIDGRGYPTIAIEYQGTGHFTPGAFERDNVKKQALENAGIHVLEVFDDFRWEDVQLRLDTALDMSEKMPA